MSSQYIQHLKSSFLFQTLSEESADSFLQNSRLTNYDNDHAIYDVGDTPESVYFVVSGSVKLEVPMPDGEIMFMGVMPMYTLFGEHEALCSTHSVARIAAVGASEILVIPKTNFLRLFKAEASFSQALAQQLAMSMRMMCLAAAHHFNSSAEKKLASLLIHLANRVGDDSGEHVKIALKLSQDELAHMMSSTRQTVNKYLKAWKDQGWIDIHQGMIEIKQVSKLQALTSEELINEFGLMGA